MGVRANNLPRSPLITREMRNEWPNLDTRQPSICLAAAIHSLRFHSLRQFFTGNSQSRLCAGRGLCDPSDTGIFAH